MAIYWPTPGLKGRTFNFCVLTRWDFNFCVRSSPLRGCNAEVCTCTCSTLCKKVSSKINSSTARNYVDLWRVRQREIRHFSFTNIWSESENYIKPKNKHILSIYLLWLKANANEYRYDANCLFFLFFSFLSFFFFFFLFLFLQYMHPTV